MAADGAASSQIAATVGVTPVTLRSWRTRFAQRGLAKFSVVRGGRGRKPGVSPEKVQEIVRLTQHEKPSGATHWSCWSTKNRSGTTTSDYRRQATTTSD
jgi:transposase